MVHYLILRNMEQSLKHLVERLVGLMVNSSISVGCIGRLLFRKLLIAVLLGELFAEIFLSDFLEVE